MIVVVHTIVDNVRAFELVERYRLLEMGPVGAEEG